jgi:hypothetical protein
MRPHDSGVEVLEHPAVADRVARIRALETPAFAAHR